MPVSRSHLTRPKPRQVRVDLGEGDELNIVFDANRITPAWMRHVQERDEAQDYESLPKALAGVLISWDVQEDDGSEFPPTAENLTVFSYPAQSSLLMQILQAAIPSDAEGNASSEVSSSPPAVSSEPAPTSIQNGATSESPVPSESLQPT